MAFGLSTSGFTQKKLADIVASLQVAEEAVFGSSILDKVTGSNINQLNATFAAELASVWQLLQDVYSQSYPSTAGGTNLALLGQLTGATPLQATQSWTAEVLVGTNGTVVPASTLFAVTGTLAIFQTLASSTIVTTPAWVTATSYLAGSGSSSSTATVGALVARGGNIYYCVQSGISSGGPSGTGTSIVDGTCLWNFVATATAAVATIVVSQSYSPIPAAAYNLTIIQTSVGGLSTITNPLGATLGTLAETDAAFRIRRALLLRSSGNATIAAITAQLLQVSGVTNVIVVNNPTSVAVGLQPPNSFAPYVVGGVSQDIFNAIVKAQPAGIQSYGTTTGNGFDVLGVAQPAGYSAVASTNIYVAVTLTSNVNYSGATSVKNAIAAYANATWGSSFGAKIIANLLYNPGYFGYGTAFQVSGVTEITALNIGLTPAPVSAADIQVGATSIASFNSANILVNGV